MRTRTHWRLRAAAVLAGLSTGVAACNTDSILRVKDPDIIDPGAINSAAGADALRVGAFATFTQAMDGNCDSNAGDGLIMITGLLADEFRVADTFDERIQMDTRNIQEQNATSAAQYRRLQRANVSARIARMKLSQFKAADSASIAEMHAITGYTEVMAAEAFCSGVPFSQVSAGGDVTPGPPLSRQETLTLAIAHFDSALAISNQSTVTSLASIGEARAILDNADATSITAASANAAAAVASVPASFLFMTTHDVAKDTLILGVYTQNPDVKRYSVADSATTGNGVNGINWRGDPRAPIDMPLTSSGAVARGFDSVTPLWKLRRYPLTQAATDTMYRDTPVPLASGVEAQLIKAEAALNADHSGATWLPLINDMRLTPGKYGANISAMSALTIPVGATFQDIVRLHFRERAMWLFATAHRLGDMRRMIRQYGFAADKVFPVGVHFKGGDYGTDVNLPVPQSERNNPLFKGCLDRNP
jgi:starch-binding outer membrane protein, SusD/RagB family